MLSKEELWERVIPEPNSGCWLWEGPYDSDGYGRFKNNGVHRLSYELFCSKIPEGKLIMHSCDQPSCVNPDHLTPGTIAENIADAAQKGRRAKQDGENNNSAQLTEADVLRIRRDRRPARIAAPDYGISKFHFWKIRSRQYWKDVA